MTRLLAYACGKDERERYARFGPEYGFEVTCVPERPLPENISTWPMRKRPAFPSPAIPIPQPAWRTMP